MAWEGKSPIMSVFIVIFGPLFDLMLLQSVCLRKCLSVDQEALFPVAPPCVLSWWLSAGQAAYESHFYAVRYGRKSLAEPARVAEPCYCFAYSAAFLQAVIMWACGLILKEGFHECAEDIGAGHPCLPRAGSQASRRGASVERRCTSTVKCFWCILVLWKSVSPTAAPGWAQIKSSFSLHPDLS